MRRCVLVACLLATVGIVGVRADEPVAAVVAAATDAPVAAVAASSALDADDAALMELGIDLAHRVEPAPDHITVRPSDHEEATIAKFPMLHEMKGAEAKDWQDIQSLLFREPPAAGEETTDMKLDELEKKFEAIDAKPVPSPIAPKGGNKLMPSLKKPELGLRGTLPQALQPRLQQKPNDEKDTKKETKKDAKKDAKKDEAKAPAADAKNNTTAKKPASKSAAQDKSKSKAKGKAKGKTDAALAARASETVATVHEIEARLNGLRGAMARLKKQMHIKGAAAADATKRIEATLEKHRKEKKDLQDRMAAHKARFAVLGDEATEAEAGEDLNFAETEAGADATAETEVDAESEAAIATEAELAAEAEQSLSTGVDADIDADADADAKAETESESKAESELSEDAEAVDEILDTLM